MSIYLFWGFKEGGPQVASTGGWYDFTEWAGTLGGEYTALAELVTEGFTEDVAGLRAELAAVVADAPPEAEDVAETLRLLVDAVGRAPDDAEIILVNDGTWETGLGGDGGEEEEDDD